MNKHLIVSGIVVLLICVGLSGCEESGRNDNINGDVSGDTNDVELVNYEIVTYGADSGWESPKQIGTGFIHNEKSQYGFYRVTGTIKNVAGNMLNSITVKIKFYDGNNNYLKTKSDYFSNIANSYTKDFSVTYYPSDSYYENVENIKIDISAS